MLVPLEDDAEPAVRQLFETCFDRSEDAVFQKAWITRRRDVSVGLWENGQLLAATVVSGQWLEFIFVSETCRGSGIGTLLLQTVLAKVPALLLTPVNDRRVIRWYESQGFRATGTFRSGEPVYRSGEPVYQAANANSQRPILFSPPAPMTPAASTSLPRSEPGTMFA